MSSHQKEKWGSNSTGLTSQQIEVLEYNFNNVSKQPHSTSIMLIAAETGLTEEETKKWFKERLAKWRESEGLPRHCGSVMD
ncbi:homeodomain-only protein [Xenopus laevis]|uniref:Homeodomain-only protein n=2 Tax=Xenopus laevis TaxID=8355 RepID=A0A1L8HXH2_XENLA|nr:homeodomain-only protein [Xenopus laevis]XP_018112319.1 homeodomain-only protein [Xenopus laevis]XP_041418957.1 homeodomain-only protein [Xenopus laevis]OCU00816.1 hypothetical protein XELAEV_18006593mg [Xenopus laevis]